MGEITQEVHFEMLEKLPDGNYKAKYPKVKSKSGVTFDEHLEKKATQNQLGHTMLPITGSWSDTTTKIINGETYIKTIPLGKVCTRVIMKAEGVDNNGFLGIVENGNFIRFLSNLTTGRLCMYRGSVSVVGESIFSIATGGLAVALDNAYIDGENLVLKFKNHTTSANRVLRIVLDWEAI